MVIHWRYLSPDDIASSNPYLSAPISTRRNTTSGLISIECLVYFWIYLTFFIIPFVSLHHAQPLYPCFIFSLRLCAPLVHSFPDSSLTSAYSFLSRTHMPLFFADSFVHTTHFDSNLLTNRSHTPYPLCFLISSFLGKRSPIWANNRVDTSSHASLFHVFK